MEYIELFLELIKSIDILAYGDDTKKDEIERKLTMYIQKCFGKESDYLVDVEKIDFYSWDFENETSQSEAWKSGCDKLTNLIKVIVEDIELSGKGIKENPNLKEGSKSLVYNKVFIVHGHDEALKLDVARFVEKLGLEAIILHEQASGGKTIIEKFEEYSDVGFVLALLSPDDKITKNIDEKETVFFRARQNVIFEMGYFIGKMGRNRVLAIVKGDKIDIPSDYSGVVYTKYGGGDWKIDLIKELKNADYVIDANKAF